MLFIGVHYRFSYYGCGEVFVLKETIWGKERPSKITADFFERPDEIVMANNSFRNAW